MAAPSVFGQVGGVLPGATFVDRDAVRAAGLHRHGQAGISGRYEDGADAIVVSGGYRDDRDEGDWILYTGQGGRDAAGRQVSDQTLTRGNLGLVLSEERGLPVRVIRGSQGDPRHSPRSGYRYDGLYLVERHFIEASFDGPLIYRFDLRRSDAQGPWLSNEDVPIGEANPKTALSVTQRVVRNSAVTQYVKALYDYTCQFCDTRLEVGASAYAEGVHIRPLGGKHAGADVVSNVLCLCPNDHVLFDKGGLYINSSMELMAVGEARPRRRLRLRHQVDGAAVRYHSTRIAGVTAGSADG